MSIDESLDEASRELRRFSSARSDSVADEAFDSLTRCHLPAIGAECPAYAKALGGTLQWLIAQRASRGWVPSI